jgi:hypothetical protein
MRRRPSRSIVGLCVAVIVLAALWPGLATFDCASLEPQWVLLPDEVSVAVESPVAPADEQPVPLLSLAPSRAPPFPSLA